MEEQSGVTPMQSGLHPLWDSAPAEMLCVPFSSKAAENTEDSLLADAGSLSPAAGTVDEHSPSLFAQHPMDEWRLHALPSNSINIKLPGLCSLSPCITAEQDVAQLSTISRSEKAAYVEPIQALQQSCSFDESQLLPSSSTFIHFDMLGSSLMDGRTSIESTQAVPAQQCPAWDSPPTEMELKHFRGECSPCAYFFKWDSCRWGAQCEFCHLCPKGEIKSRKKEKVKALRAQRQMEAAERSRVNMYNRRWKPWRVA